jgi:hypothetical protein
MYKTGEPCSACPAGTACSEVHPGLCSGTPDGPVTVKPPIRNFEGISVILVQTHDVATKPPIFSGPFQREGPKRKRPAVQNLPPVFIVPPSVGTDRCVYECKESSGCSVKFVTRNS